MSAFVLQTQDLDESGKDWTFAIGRGWLSSALADTDLEPGAKDGRLEVHAQQTGVDVLVQGRIHAELAAACARCLESVSIGIDLPMTVLFSPEQARPDDTPEVEVRLDEMSRDYFGGREIVLDEMVREHLLVEAPMKPLCSEECEGIAVPEHLRPPEEVFGAAVPDARLAPLMKLKEQLTKNEE